MTRRQLPLDQLDMGHSPRIRAYKTHSHDKTIPPSMYNIYCTYAPTCTCDNVCFHIFFIPLLLTDRVRKHRKRFCLFDSSVISRLAVGSGSNLFTHLAQSQSLKLEDISLRTQPRPGVHHKVAVLFTFHLGGTMFKT